MVVAGGGGHSLQVVEPGATGGGWREVTLASAPQWSPGHRSPRRKPGWPPQAAAPCRRSGHNYCSCFYSYFWNCYCVLYSTATTAIELCS